MGRDFGCGIIQITRNFTAMKTLLAVLILFVAIVANSQTTTVGLVYNSGNAYEGYTLFTPGKNNSVYLVDNCGQKVNEWTFSETPGATCYLLENGTLLRAGSDSLELRDWDNTLLWSYAMNANGYLQHHDIEPLPNGNILCLLTDNYTEAEMVEKGRIPGTVSTQFKLDKIIELEPMGSHDANLVWEWKFYDHFVQDHNDTLSNYSVVADHPELLDVNFQNGHNNDYTHVNGIDYNAELDQIVMSARHLSEVYIIDHSTSISQAAGSTGGNSGLGGDFLWRWGNPQVYDQGTIADQKIFSQHDSKWVEPGYLDAGKISVFNNDGDTNASFSAVHLIEPEINNGAYTMSNGAFNPTDFDWSWSGSILGTAVDERKKCGGHSLPNGNFVVCETKKGRISEIQKDGTLVWSYVNPSGEGISVQYDNPTNYLTNIFRGEKYPFDYAGLSGKDLSPKGLIEDLNVLSDTCLITLDTDQKSITWPTVINPVRNNRIELMGDVQISALQLMDLQGKVVTGSENSSILHLPEQIVSGIYLIEMQSGDQKKFVRVLIL